MSTYTKGPLTLPDLKCVCVCVGVCDRFNPLAGNVNHRFLRIGRRGRHLGDGKLHQHSFNHRCCCLLGCHRIK